MEEQELISRSRAGDVEAFNLLVEQYQRLAYNLALRMLGNTEAAEDATQDAFLSAYRAIGKFRGGSFKAWILRITANSCHDKMRVARRARVTSLDTLLEVSGELPLGNNAESPEDYVLRRELGRFLSEGLVHLPEDQRLAVILCDIQGLSYEEICQATGSSLGTVKSRLNRGRARLGTFCSSAGNFCRLNFVKISKRGCVAMFLGGRKTRCHKVRGMLSEYIDNRLDSEDRVVVERHLEICESCSNELESLQMTVQLLNQVPEMPVPRSFAIREADVVGERVPEPRRPGELQPVPVLATGEVETGRVSIFEPQRLGWLRSATAFVTIALIALLMVDFLQVIPHDVGTDGGEVSTYTIEERVDEPAPVPGEEAPTEDVTSDESGLGVTYEGEEEISGESAAGWPLRQIEIAMGVLVFALVALMLFARRQRRRWSKI